MTAVDPRPASRGLRRRIGAWLKSAGAIVALAPVLCAIPAFIVFKTWLEATSLKAEWSIKGPTCPTVAAPSPVATRRHKRPVTFQYYEASFTRSFGGVSCGSVPESSIWPSENYRVCRFNNPGAVVVRTAGRAVVFEPGVGRPATVTVRRGQASCVIGGWFAY
jgi:hypothetical protein